MNKATCHFLYTLSFIIFLSCQQKPTEVNTSHSYLEEITVRQLQEGYANGTFTIEQVVSDYLARIEAIDKKGPAINAIIVVMV